VLVDLPAMKIAYLDCASGISGDMLLGALVDAGADLAEIQRGIDSLGLSGCRLTVHEVKKRGFRATHLVVEHEPEHAHRHLHHIVAMIDGSEVIAPPAKQLAKRAFTRLGEAEAKVHGTTIEKVHFHEVGAVDSIADIVGAAIGWTLLGIEAAQASPIPTGHGFVEIAHGRCSIPAPATGELLRGVPLAELDVEGELTTPTGAALVSTLAGSFGPLPPMRVETIGYGAGTRDYPQANLLRLMIGEAEPGPPSEQIWVVETNLDDASGETVGWCIGRLRDAGALDVFTSAIQMKKDRPGVKLTVLCEASRKQHVERILFQETTTLGVRSWPVWRSTLPREMHVVRTEWGDIDGVLSIVEGERKRFSPEYESCRRAAIEHRVPLQVVQEAAVRAFRPEDV
jgi:hypothetical protein